MKKKIIITGGAENTLSLLEFLDMLKKKLAKKPKVKFSPMAALRSKDICLRYI